MSVSLSIVFTGLCALVGSGDGRPAQVLLLDARGVGQVRGVTLPEHAPTLVVSLSDLANPDTSAPTRVVVGQADPTGRVDQLGLWDLAGSEIRIRAQGEEATGVRFFRPTGSETSWPEPPSNVQDPSAWRDLRFVAQMQALAGDGRIDPAVVDDGEASRWPRAVAARIHLDAGLLAGGIPSQQTYRADLFEFKGAAGTHSIPQALTDSIQWTLETGAAAVAIDIIPVAGGATRRLLLAPSATPHRLYVSNLPVENSASTHAQHATGDDEMSALHFGAYYELLLNQPTDKPLPELWRPVPGRNGTGMLRPVFCPPAMFSRP